MKLNRSTQGSAPIEFHRVAIARSRDGARTIMKIRSFLTAGGTLDSTRLSTGGTLHIAKSAKTGEAVP